MENVLQNVCPNCGGGFAPRPIRPVEAWRLGLGLLNDPASTTRKHASKSTEEMRDLTARLRDVPPAQR